MDQLKAKMQQYAPISEAAWQDLLPWLSWREIPSGGHYLHQGEKPDSFAFVDQGLLRMYLTDDAGREYNKIFFNEGTFPGSMVALLTGVPSEFSIQALEDSRLIILDFAAYRKILRQHADLMWFQIRYLEANWVIAKEPREVALAHEDASYRYQAFLENHPDLEARLPQYHIAAHIGVTPTQLSRIRRQVTKN